MGNRSQLFEIADGQQGFFTSEQAESCGFSRSNFHLKIKSGEWVKQLWGVYKLAQYPLTERPELVLWSLWSRGKDGMPQGVWSHETALDIYELSDVMPVKMHMSVPTRFRKSAEIPKHLVLHFEDVPAADIKEQHGYGVTKPGRTIMDVIQENRVSDEHIIVAMRQALERGVVTLREMRDIIEWMRKMGKEGILEEIEKLVWRKRR